MAGFATGQTLLLETMYLHENSVVVYCKFCFKLYIITCKFSGKLISLLHTAQFEHAANDISAVQLFSMQSDSSLQHIKQHILVCFSWACCRLLILSITVNAAKPAFMFKYCAKSFPGFWISFLVTAEPTFLHVSGVNQARLHSIMQQWVLPSIVYAAYV